MDVERKRLLDVIERLEDEVGTDEDGMPWPSAFDAVNLLREYGRLGKEEPSDVPIPDDLMCPCGHTAHWHSEGGRGKCEYGAPSDCDCQSIGEGAEGEEES